MRRTHESAEPACKELSPRTLRRTTISTLGCSLTDFLCALPVKLSVFRGSRKKNHVRIPCHLSFFSTLFVLLFVPLCLPFSDASPAEKSTHVVEAPPLFAVSRILLSNTATTLRTHFSIWAAYFDPGQRDDQENRCRPIAVLKQKTNHTVNYEDDRKCDCVTVPRFILILTSSD